MKKFTRALAVFMSALMITAIGSTSLIADARGSRSFKSNYSTGVKSGYKSSKFFSATPKSSGNSVKSGYKTGNYGAASKSAKSKSNTTGGAASRYGSNGGSANHTTNVYVNNRRSNGAGYFLAGLFLGHSTAGAPLAPISIIGHLFAWLIIIVLIFLIIRWLVRRRRR